MVSSYIRPTPPRPPITPRPPIVADRIPTTSSRPSVGGATGALTPASSTRPTSVGGASGALTPGTQFNSSGGGPATPRPTGGGGGGGGGGQAPAPVDMGPEMEEYWWTPDWRDSAYLAQIAAINRALGDFETELGLGGERYGTDYLRGIRELGFRPGEGFNAAVDVLKLPGVGEKGAPGAAGLGAIRGAMQSVMGPAAQAGEGAAAARSAGQGGQWDYEGQFSPFSAAARGTRTARDEFAGRGMLKSSDFAKSYADFQDRMQDQLMGMETGRARFFEDAAMNLAQQRAQAEERRQSAQRDAVMRAAGMGEWRERRA